MQLAAFRKRPCPRSRVFSFSIADYLQGNLASVITSTAKTPSEWIDPSKRMVVTRN